MILPDFRTHIKKRLGSPLINIEITDDQMDICINDAIEDFIETHYDGLDEGYIFLDVTEDTAEYTLPDTVHSVVEIISLSTTLISDEPLLIQPYLVGNSAYASGMSSPSVLDMMLFKQNVAIFQNVMKSTVLFEWNSTTHLIKFMKTPDADARYALRVHASPASNELIYENKWVQKYSTCLCKIQWGENLQKFGGATLPGGVAINFDQIIEQGNTKKEELELELQEKYQEPIDFFVG